MKHTRIATVIKYQWVRNTFLNLMGRSYLSHIKYRLGAYYTTPYYKIGGKEATREYGVTAGFGLPVPRSRSILSISGQFVRISGQESGFCKLKTSSA